MALRTRWVLVEPVLATFLHVWPLHRVTASSQSDATASVA
eukprot:CAMPEP_0119315832 /NCGR_PEP_ID=MMETSP1333-20130426/37356_1 /TAXON_ID=418940 /ORGANISM="Scyphosphaera apsteinii, Strain RCC1455" /LENGTH=39 /DNA_ID= /DNA_START= /DNA_END= /DNA_ORIENTATION=